VVPEPPDSERIRCGRSRLDWATLLRRVFAWEVLLCACGGQRRVLAAIREGPVARKLLAHLGLPTHAPSPSQGGLFSTGPPAPSGLEVFADPPWVDDVPDFPSGDAFV